MYIVWRANLKRRWIRESGILRPKIDNPNEMGGLIPDYITTQRELNELERQNVAGRYLRVLL
jgi:hypothetical protein